MHQLANRGSTARDFLATERNFLTQCRFGLLLSLLSSSFLLRARLFSEPNKQPSAPEPARLPFGYLYLASSIGVLGVGLWYYTVSSRRLKARRAFLRVTNLQTATLTLLATLVLVTCIILLIDDK